MDLDGKVALVTGGSSGIGQTTAVAFAREGANVALTYHFNRAGGDETVRLIEEHDGHAIALQTNVSQSAEVKAMVDATVDQFGTVDILVNSAGVIGPLDLVSQIEAEEWERTISVNLTGTFLCCQAVLGPMMAQRRGKIVNVSSGIGTRVFPHFTAYGVSKAGLSHLAMVCAHRLAPEGITVFEIRPGVIRTDMTAGVQGKYDALIADGLVPQERWGEPEDLKGVAIFLDKKILYGPGKAANAGGVATSGLEMSQKSLRLSWTREEVDQRLQGIMKAIHKAAFETSKEFGLEGNYVAGANIAGFIKVADSMLDQGVI